MCRRVLAVFEFMLNDGSETSDDVRTAVVVVDGNVLFGESTSISTYFSSSVLGSHGNDMKLFNALASGLKRSSASVLINSERSTIPVVMLVFRVLK